MILKFAYYQKKDWRRFRKIVNDKHKLHDSWEDWHTDFKKAKKQLASLGFEVEKVVVNLDDLIAYCKEKGKRIDGKARSAFVQEE